MNSEHLSAHNGYLSSTSGYSLNVEERASLQTSLQILKRNQKFNRVTFWGKVFGISKDYLVAQGYGVNAFGPKKSFVSHNGVDWVQLPELDAENQRLVDFVRGKFTGDPSAETILEVLPNGTLRYEQHKPAKKKEDEDEDEDEDDRNGKGNHEKGVKRVSVNEEKRLVRLIQRVDHDCSVAPRGAFTCNAHHHIVENGTFGGLPHSQLSQLGSYFHLREPQNLAKKTLLQREDLVKTLDFADPLSEDLPNGVWAVQQDRVTNLVTLRSFLWPGYFFFNAGHAFGSAYFGWGEDRTHDIGFVL